MPLKIPTSRRKWNLELHDWKPFLSYPLSLLQTANASVTGKSVLTWPVWLTLHTECELRSAILLLMAEIINSAKIQCRMCYKIICLPRCCLASWQTLEHLLFLLFQSARSFNFQLKSVRPLCVQTWLGSQWFPLFPRRGKGWRTK